MRMGVDENWKHRSAAEIDALMDMDEYYHFVFKDKA